MDPPLTSSLSEADILILLIKKRCRQTLRIVQSSASPLAAIELARRIANREYDNPSAEEAQTIYLSLHNNYLPQLDEADVVEYDTSERTVRPGKNFDVVMGFLANVKDTDLPWSGQ